MAGFLRGVCMTASEFIEYLEKHFPSGKEAQCEYISWKTLFLLANANLNGEDCMEDLLTIRSVVMQRDIKTAVYEITEQLKRLFNGKYPFIAEDVFDSYEIFMEYSYEYEQISSDCSYKKRRAKACKVTQIKTVRESVFKSDGYKCVYCNSTKDLTVDHIKPVSHGGEDEFSNFQTLCRRCNSSKSDKIVSTTK